jgi:ATP-dependent RNA helicase SUPV3L1/SUV3
MIKQIAGRAGRRSSTFGRGLVATASPGDMPRLRDALATPLEALPAQLAGLFPEYEHLEVFAGQRPDAPFRRVCLAPDYADAHVCRRCLWRPGTRGSCLTRVRVSCVWASSEPPLVRSLRRRSLLGSFGATALLDSAYFFCKQDSVQAAADLLAEVSQRARENAAPEAPA